MGANESVPKSPGKVNSCKELLIESWAVVKSQGEGETRCIRQFYKLMMSRGGERVRRLFAFTDMPRQEHMITSVVKWALSDHYDPTGMQKLGVVHAHLGVEADDLPIFSSAFIDTLRTISKDRWRVEYEKAWQTVFDEISVAMRPAMEEAQRVISTVTNESSKEKEMVDAHRSLVAWFSDQTGTDSDSDIRSESGSFVVEDLSVTRQDFEYTAKHIEAKGYDGPRHRTLEIRGRLLYIKRQRSESTVRVVDLSLANDLSSETGTSADGKPEYTIFLTANSINHKLITHSETRYEDLMQRLGNAMHQFGSDSPAPTLDNLLEQGNSILGGAKLHFVPGDFMFMTLLGRGSFGKVVKVMHKVSKKVYAMKVIHKNNFRSVRNVVEVRREKAILAQIDHPFIVKFHGVFQTEDKLYFLFDFLSGGELFHHTKNAAGHHFTEDVCKFYLAEIACALEHLRKHRIIHRDIKGDNFVLDKEGHVVLTDFGFAKVLDNNRRNRSTCGTLAYIAPEVICPTPLGYNYEVDWWSMGVVMFTMLTGFFPFLRPKPQDTAKAIVRDPLRFPPNPKLSPEAQDVCRQLLQKRSCDRITTLDQLKAHAFFKNFDWVRLEKRQLTPPFVPDTDGSNTKYFSKKYTQSHDVTDGPPLDLHEEHLTREKDVFSSFFWAQEAAGSVKEASDSDSESTASTDGFARASTSPHS